MGRGSHSCLAVGRAVVVGTVVVVAGSLAVDSLAEEVVVLAVDMLDEEVVVLVGIVVVVRSLLVDVVSAAGGSSVVVHIPDQTAGHTPAAGEAPHSTSLRTSE